MKQSGLDLVLVRHGVTDWNEEHRLMGRTGVSINERGRAQAREAAEALSALDVSAVYSSPRTRTRQTAEPIAETHALPVILEPALDEVWLQDAWIGKTVTELRGDPDIERLLADPTYRCPCIEPIEEVQKRVVALVEKLRKDHAEQTVVLVSHADPIRALLAHYRDIPLTDLRSLEVTWGQPLHIHIFS